MGDTFILSAPARVRSWERGAEASGDRCRRSRSLASMPSALSRGRGSTPAIAAAGMASERQPFWLVTTP